MASDIIKTISNFNDALKGGSKMAKKRMFSLDVVDTDDFLDLPCSAQALYFHLGMHGDDDGFIANPRRIMHAVGGRPRDFHTLVAKGYIIPFDSGVIAVRDWRINNDLKNDRYHETLYAEEKDLLTLDDSRRYVLDTGRIHVGSKAETEHNIT